uniref:Menorin-like domain-containing protein n=1 Tax=Timema cristinae TaxID=61476 RepID=A0A7R9DDW4_TIMCR|nr:unnamed protein product [Timema cristinae]
MKLASCEEMPSIRKFFHLKNNDLTTVTWAQNINSNKAFQWALNGKKMMIGGDVIVVQMGFGKNKKPVPKMYSHYNNDIEMTLKQLLEKAADTKSFGVQLNFNQITVFIESIKVLQAMRGKIKFPLWLNADTDNMEDKDIDNFLSLCTHNFPKATISIGMLHKGQKLRSEQGYNAKLVTQMKDTLTRNNVTQTVAFPVEAHVASYSLDTLPALKDVHGITDSALYIYNRQIKVYSRSLLCGKEVTEKPQPSWSSVRSPSRCS